jgi:hypothetical protein
LQVRCGVVVEVVLVAVDAAVVTDAPLGIETTE